MSNDATFEDGAARPVQVVAMDEEDLSVLSALAQDAIFPITEMTWQPKRRRLGFLVNRMRWEEQAGAGKPERVQALLVLENVLGVASQGVDRSDSDTILSILSVSFEPAEDAEGYVVVTLAGDGAIRARVEALEVALRDVTRPYAAVSGKVPKHPE